MRHWATARRVPDEWLRQERSARPKLTTMHRNSSSLLLFAALAVATACREEPRAYRGPGLQVAALPLSDRAAVYRAALGGSFRIDDPSLWILVDPMLLPRSAGLAGGDTMPPDVMAALRQSGVVKATCVIPVRKSRGRLL